MDALGLPTPTTWHGTATTVTGTLSTLAALSEKFGPRVTVGELIRAGTKTEILTVAGGISAAWYLGAAIGSAAVATGNYTSCGTRISDVFTYATMHRMLTPRIKHQLVAFPEIYDVNRKRRHCYGMMARVQT
jgi:hypothetical protein